MKIYSIIPHEMSCKGKEIDEDVFSFETASLTPAGVRNQMVRLVEALTLVFNEHGGRVVTDHPHNSDKVRIIIETTETGSHALSKKLEGIAILMPGTSDDRILREFERLLLR